MVFICNKRFVLRQQLSIVCFYTLLVEEVFSSLLHQVQSSGHIFKRGPIQIMFISHIFPNHNWKYIYWIVFMDENVFRLLIYLIFLMSMKAENII